jgi:hypothetical protein
MSPVNFLNQQRTFLDQVESPMQKLTSHNCLQLNDRLFVIVQSLSEFVVIVSKNCPFYFVFELRQFQVLLHLLDCHSKLPSDQAALPDFLNQDRFVVLNHFPRPLKESFHHFKTVTMPQNSSHRQEQSHVGLY